MGNAQNKPNQQIQSRKNPYMVSNFETIKLTPKQEKIKNLLKKNIFKYQISKIRDASGKKIKGSNYDNLIIIDKDKKIIDVKILSARDYDTLFPKEFILKLKDKLQEKKNLFKRKKRGGAIINKNYIQSENDTLYDNFKNGIAQGVGFGIGYNLLELLILPHFNYFGYGFYEHHGYNEYDLKIYESYDNEIFNTYDINGNIETGDEGLGDEGLGDEGLGDEGLGATSIGATSIGATNDAYSEGGRKNNKKSNIRSRLKKSIKKV